MTKKEAARAYNIAQAQRILDLFQASTGRAAKSINELTNWATSPVGEAVLAINRDPETGKIDPYN
jgi:hypothetical protein